MDYKAFLKLAEQRFGTQYAIYKEKAGHLMLDRKVDNGTLSEEAIGPDIGHSCNSPHYGITHAGWAYLYYQGAWYLVRDGIFGWREAKENPFPEIPELPDGVSVL